MDTRDVDSSRPHLTDEDFLSPAEVLVVLVRHGKMLAGVVLAAGLLAFGYVHGYPAEYESAATLVVFENQTTEGDELLSLSGIPAQGYQRILDSESVLAETKGRLVKEGVLGEKAELLAGGNLQAKLIPGTDQKSALVIQAVVTDRDPERAAKIANVWADVFVGQVQTLRAEGALTNERQLGARLPSVRQELVDLEARRVDQAKSFSKRNADVQLKWKEEVLKADQEGLARVGAQQRESVDLLTTHTTETLTKIQALKGERHLDARRAQVAALRCRLLGVPFEERGDTEAAALRARLAALTEPLKTPPAAPEAPAPATRKGTGATEGVPAPREPAPARGVRKGTTAQEQDRKPEGRSGEAAGESRSAELALDTRPALAEETGAARIPGTASRVEPLPAARPTALSLGEIKDLVAALEKETTELGQDEAVLAKLEAEREAGLQRLVQERRVGLEQIKVEWDLRRRAFLFSRDKELEPLALEEKGTLSLFETELEAKRNLFEALNRGAGRAAMVAIQEDQKNARIASRAVPPFRPLPRQTGKLVLAAVLLAGILASTVVLLREVVRRSESA